MYSLGVILETHKVPVSQALSGLPSKSQQPKFTYTITFCFPIKYTALIYLVDKHIQGQ